MRSRSDNSSRFPPDEDRYRSHSRLPEDRHRPSNSPSRSPSPTSRRSSRRYRDYDDHGYQDPPYYPSRDPDYRRYPPPSYPSQYHDAPSQRRKKKHMYHLDSEKRTKVHTIFMFNLSYKLTNENLHDICSQYGEVSEIIYPLSKPGIGFATFYDIRNSEKAVKEMNGLELDGRTVHTNYAHIPPSHSKRKLEDICANVFAKIESIQNKLSENKNEEENDPESNTSSKLDKNQDAINDISISTDDIQSALSNYGEVRSVEDRGNGVFLAKFYDIRDARKCVENKSSDISGEKVTFEFAEADLGDDETNSEFTKEEYYRRFGNENDDLPVDNSGNDKIDDKNEDNNNNETREKSKDNEDYGRYEKDYPDDRSRDRNHERNFDDYRDRKRDHRYMSHYRDDDRRRRDYMPPPPMGYDYPDDPYPPRRDYMPYPRQPMKGGRYRGGSSRRDYY